MESRIAYVPLGPRNSFPFVPRDTVPAALDRTLFFNLQVGVLQAMTHRLSACLTADRRRIIHVSAIDTTHPHVFFLVLAIHLRPCIPAGNAKT